ncbi:uncharacterized protein (TIGR02246 family) [Stackebrandtia albiflava]|uniref:Uncharacterized protein (TIGR02246 family) n=1 Tax=Stackebrandtia albiflava TaxID=406432 RepID=A0A562V1E4_9ACTN|nr:SgcJ/EcaC family oxidoreductase [Stackebrandtia albiflava]TWJ11698.1 uncharacterized protein (TIGR02246 family) [Stackebrandtia albiflava]
MTHTDDTTAVTALFDTLVAAWAAADAEAYADCFTPDADYVNFLGGHMRGRRHIVDSHEALWSTFQRNTRLHQVVDSLRFVTDDVAVLVSRGAILQRRQRAPKRRDWKVQTLVAVRRADGEWRFTAFQNTRRRRLLERIGHRRDPRLAPHL